MLAMMVINHSTIQLKDRVTHKESVKAFEIENISLCSVSRESSRIEFTLNRSVSQSCALAHSAFEMRQTL